MALFSYFYGRRPRSRLPPAGALPAPFGAAFSEKILPGESGGQARLRQGALRVPGARRAGVTIGACQNLKFWTGCPRQKPMRCGSSESILLGEGCGQVRPEQGALRVRERVEPG